MRGDSLLVAAGGTGGHLYPALAVADKYRELAGPSDITFVGTKRGLETRIVPKAGFPLELVRAEPLRGGTIGRKLKGLYGLVFGMVDAVRLVRRVRPRVVLGVGAYVSGTVLLTAALRGIPTMILEPNAEPGLANKWLAPFVDEAACAWQETTRYFRGKGFVTGNPVRQSVVDVPPLREPSTTMRVLAFGGSQGSRALNDALIESVPLLASVASRVKITHQTGPNDLERVRRAYEAGAIDACATPYIDAMDEAYADADVVVARAGATTCAELAAAGRPAVLLPLSLAGGHQESNARLLSRAGAATMITSSDLSGEALASSLLRLLDAPDERARMAAQARGLARPDAAVDVARRLVRLSERAGEQVS